MIFLQMIEMKTFMKNESVWPLTHYWTTCLHKHKITLKLTDEFRTVTKLLGNM